MLTNQLAGSTRENYATRWAAFVDFCYSSGYPSLPTTTEVVSCYVGELYERGTVAPGTLKIFLTPINSVHALCQLDKPAVGPLLIAVRHGYSHLYADTPDGLRDKRVPLPAAVLLRMVHVGRTATDVALRRRMAGLALTALTLVRPGERANIRLQGVTLQPSSISRGARQAPPTRPTTWCMTTSWP